MVSIATQRSGQQYLPPSISSTLSPNQCLLPITSRINEQDHLEVGGCDVIELVNRFGSPLYIVDEVTLRTSCQQYRQAFEEYYPGDSLVLYASKAWNCLAVCAIAASEGLGIDVVSGGELLTALEAKVDPTHIYFHGNNKSVEELQLAIDANVTIVVDNWYELETLATLTGDRPAPLPVLLRVTPGIECHTHEYIQTGHLDSKFGFDPDQLENVFDTIKQTPSITCVGLHAHIGSQIFELQPHYDLADVMVRWMIKAKEYGLPVCQLDVGGGLGMKYTEQDDPPSIKEWVKKVCDAVLKACKTHDLPLPKLLSEPGRSIMGPSCITAYTVGSQKVIPGMRTYVTVDGGMSDNPRPITYQSIYRAVIANKMSQPFQDMPVTLAGKHCESGDIVIKDVYLPEATSGDIVTVVGTGAYNYSMASNYNRIPRPAAVLASEGDASLIIRRETYQDLIRHDQMPSHLLVNH
jgi:diaminopimelate decarboxylase